MQTGEAEDPPPVFPISGQPTLLSEPQLLRSLTPFHHLLLCCFKLFPSLSPSPRCKNKVLIDGKRAYLFCYREEEEREGNEDITVVERKLFAVPLKTKSQRNWCNLSKQKKRRKATDAGHDTSQEKQRERSHEIPAKATTSRIRPESSDDGETIQAVKKKQNELETRGGNFVNKPERLKTERLLHEEKKMQKGREEELCNQQKEKEVSRTLTEPQTDDLSQTAQTEKLHSLPDITSDTNTDSVCNETKVKKRKKKKDKRQGQSQEEPEGAASLNVEGDEIPSLSEENRAGPLTSQTSDELELNQRDLTEKSSNYENILRQEERDTPDSKPKKKKKRKKNKSAAENVTQEVDGNLESDVREEDSTFLSCNAEKKKKKKRKRKADEEDVDVEQLQSRAAVEHDAKKEKRKKQCKIDEIINAEDKGNSSEASEGTIESSFLKRKKQKKKRQSNDATQDGEQDADESFFNNAVALAESTETALQKTKKKTISEGMVNSYDPEEKEDNTQKAEESRQDRNAQVVTKKKKKKKKRESEIGSRNISENSVAQSDDSVSVQEKEKKRTSSFLVADAESSQSVEAHVQVLESVCDGDLVTESAEFAGNLEEGNDGVRKKKKKKSKRKMSVSQDGVEKGHEQDFGEPKSTAESTDTEMRRKRKQTGSENRTMKTKHKKVKRRLHNPNEHFLMDP
uniref:DNA ligase 1-like n=1 Tax=Semicossyphus pulcher TaxID=241346 RepID=UPI0037E96CE0